MIELNYLNKLPEKGVYFLSLGGIGEIGANCYLYCCDGKWIMIDLGISFADEHYPGVDILVPKLDFINKISDKLEAVIISHGHEDHAGALAFFVDKINCPVYASGFASSLIKNRLKEFGKLSDVNLKLISADSKIKLENFSIEFITTTHSIPEPCSIVITTHYGKLLHTADWKIDSDPLIGNNFNFKSFKNLADENLLALIGDSTNADIPGSSLSELDVRNELINVFARYNNRIITTCFSSNIARIESIAIAAKKNNRKVALVGRSMKKTIESAIKNNLGKNLTNFINEDEISMIPKDQIVIICTGSQGEKRSALYRIAYNSHKNIRLEDGDLVIFSSRDIPGNEKLINNLKNLLLSQKIEIITSDDDLVHVSGHGYADEIKDMYDWTRPYIAVPVHGEYKHLVAHSKLAQSSQVPHTKILENGKCLKIAPEGPEIYGYFETGKMIVEGKNLFDVESNFIKDRRKFSFEGLLLVSLVIYQDFSIDKDIKLSINGLPDTKTIEILENFKNIFIQSYLRFNNDQKSSDSIVSELVKSSVRKIIKNEFGKKPEIKTHIIRL